MKVLATPFIKLWNWIKETAWIQPLLIVGVVFAIIFSISPFVNWIDGLNSTETETNSYYSRFKYSLEGILSSSGNDNSDAGKLMKNILIAIDMQDGTEKDQFISKNLPGKKFFFLFVQESCTSCQEAKEGFETLEQNWNNGYYIPTDGLPFKVATIFADQKVDNDTDNSSLTGFGKFLDNYPDFFDQASANIQDTPYYIQKNIDDTKLSYFESADVDNFQTPTIILMDFTATGMNGASELMFNVANEGSDTSGGTAKARTLIDCWNGVGKFELKNN
jgi:thiol-disulfide isomerase/thioredoxin